MSFLEIDRDVRVLILGEEYSRAKIMLDEIVRFREDDILLKRESKTNCAITMKNGTYYEARKFSMSQKGQKCDLLYYDTKIDKDVFEEAFCSVTICSIFKEIDSEFATYVEFDPEDFSNNKWQNDHGVYQAWVESLKIN